jgi:hypothetical protein
MEQPFIIFIAVACFGLMRLCRYLGGMLRRLARKRMIAAPQVIFDEYYIDGKLLYVKKFGKLPSVNSISGMDTAMLCGHIHNGSLGQVLERYQSNYFNWTEKKLQSNRTLFVLEGNLLLELGHEYVSVYHDNQQEECQTEILNSLLAFKAGAKAVAYEINILTLTSGGLQLKHLPVSPTNLDIDLYYNDDFKAVDELIRSRLEQENDKGIILLHGLPGTGKTTYLRHLIGTLTKKVLFVSPTVAGNLMSPEFIDILIDNPNTVLVIEDAEQIILDRKMGGNSVVSSLLNVSDGLLSDCLNVQLICTFNSALNLVDPAFLRKGRLIARYEFGKLDPIKAQRLSDHLGHERKISQGMTLAEIANPEGAEPPRVSTEIAGFRREAVMN